MRTAAGDSARQLYDEHDVQVPYPGLARLDVRVITLQNISGDGCTSTPVALYGWVRFTGRESKGLAWIGGGQCFRLEYRADNANSAHRTHYGPLVF